MISDQPLKIAICVGEASGDTLAQGLIAELKADFPNATFFGIAGPKMIAEGVRACFDLETIAVMGFSDVIKRLPQILSVRKQFIQLLKKEQPDLYIGIDAPDFNLPIERVLKRAGIKTAHYVSPSVWAWRKRRIHKIKKSVDLMLTLLPFENEIYEQNQIPVQFVGHPLADSLLPVNKQQPRATLGLPQDKPIMALLPGSRQMEIKLLGKIYLQTAKWCWQREPALEFVIPLSQDKHVPIMQALAQEVCPECPIHFYVQQTRTALQASDLALVTSGTATLETMLLGKPMVVAYRVTWFNALILRMLLKIRHFSLPNLLANKIIVPENIQDQVVPDVLGKQLLYWLQHPKESEHLLDQFATLSQKLRCNANKKAAQAISQLITG